MMDLVVNADDYGMNPNCTHAITQCLLAGKITNTTLMVNMPHVNDAVASAVQNGLKDKIGLHINLTQGAPLTDNIRSCRVFCNESGQFNREFRRGIRRCWTPLSKDERMLLREEVSAQFQKYFDLGMTTLHYDSHHHSHLVPNVVTTIAEVAHDFGFKSVRRSVNTVIRKGLKSKVFYVFQNAFLDSRLDRFGLCRTHYFGALEDVRQSQAAGTLKDGNAIELMVHPMYMKDGVLDEFGELNDSGLRPFSEVTEFLKIHQGELSLKSFKDLYEGCSEA